MNCVLQSDDAWAPRIRLTVRRVRLFDIAGGIRALWSPLLGLSCALLISNSVYGEGDPDKGAMEIIQCTACHTLGENVTTTDPKGPDIGGIVGAPIAARDGFDYSDAMRAFAAENGVWSEALLDAFLEWPSKAVPGTSMDVSGITQGQARQDLIAFLKKTPE